MRKSPLILFLFLPLIGLLALLAGIALGQDNQQTVPSSVATAGISYQGYLVDSNGDPLTGQHNFQFALYNQVSGGDILWLKVYSNIPVENGLLDIVLDVDTADFNGQALWLAVSVDGELLSPRKELLPVPYALTVRPGAEVIGDSGGFLFRAQNEGEGVGLRGESVGGYGVSGRTDSDREWDAAGVLGLSIHDRTFGVLGYSDWGIGVEGSIRNTDNNNAAVVGYHEGPGEGIAGYSAAGHGVSGSTDGYTAYAGHFVHNIAGGSGLYAEGGDERSADVILGGPLGHIATDPTDENADLWIISNESIGVWLDIQDEGENQTFAIHNSAYEPVFLLDEIGHLAITGYLTAENIDANGWVCEEFTINSSGMLPVEVPEFCDNNFCTLLVEFDGQMANFSPGLFWPVTYKQDYPSDYWVAGPAIDIGGDRISCGMGRNGDGNNTCIIGGGATEGGGSWSLMDDGGLLEDSPDYWSLWLETGNDLSYITLTACPLGEPRNIYPGP